MTIVMTLFSEWTSIICTVKVATIEQFANILESESIAVFIMQTERNIYAFAVGSLPFLWMLCSYFCIFASCTFVCKKNVSSIVIIQIVDMARHTLLQFVFSCIKSHVSSKNGW